MSGGGAARTRRAWALALGAVLVLLCIATFGQTLGHEFLRYDDPFYLHDNPNLREGPTPAAVWRAFREPYFANWIPLTLVSYQIDHAIHGLEPAGFHATNLLLHALGALLLFAALARLSGALGPSAFTAAVFAVHPLHVESVAWVAERKDVLSGVFFALALLLWARYAERPGAARYLAVVAAFAAGLLSKPMLVTLPCVLLLLDFWPLDRLSWRAVLEKLPLFALSALASAAALHAQQQGGTLAQADLLPFDARLANAAIALVAYLRDALWPARLSVFYPHPLDDASRTAAALAAAALLAVTAVCWRLRGRAPWLLVGWLWFHGMLVPVLGLVQVGLQARADRYTYLPLVGLALALVWSVDAAARSVPARRAAAVAGVAWVLALAVAAHLQTRHWSDTLTLFRHAASATRDNWLAHEALGSELLRIGETDEALREYREAVRANPKWWQAQRGLADVYAARGEWQEAIRAYDRSLRLAPRDAVTHMRLARALAATGQTSEALGRARHALRLARGARRAEARVVLGFVHERRGELDAAIASYEAALDLRPDLAEAHAARGVALLRSARPEAARAALTRALALARARGDARLEATILRALSVAGLEPAP